MTHLQKSFMVFVVVLLAVMLTPLSAGNGNQDSGALNILLTNDDGYQSPLIHAVREVLIAVGHNVTIVAPLENQSGTGATLKEVEWVEVIEQAPGIWSVDNTPTGAVMVALDLIMADNPPDLIISGMNFGQNLGLRASTASGTVNAAHIGLQRGFPSIACSLGILIEEMNETPVPFPSTFASIAPAAQFMAQLVDQLQMSSKDGRILPPDTMLAVNFPVPYDEIKGIRFTRLGKLTLADVAYADPNNVIPNGGGLVQAYGVFYEAPDPVPNSDSNALWDNYISITVMDGDMSTPHPPSVTNKIKQRLSFLSFN
jgi:5'/3'-nucleotidase SurE